MSIYLPCPGSNLFNRNRPELTPAIQTCLVLQLQHNSRVIHSYSLHALTLQQHRLFKEVFAIYFSQKHLSLSWGLTSTIPRVDFKPRLQNKHVCTHFLHGDECKLKMAFSKKDKDDILWKPFLCTLSPKFILFVAVPYSKRAFWRLEWHLLSSSPQTLLITMTFQKWSWVTLLWYLSALSAVMDSSCQDLWTRGCLFCPGVL